jgi:hypothetical protein
VARPEFAQGAVKLGANAGLPSSVFEAVSLQPKVGKGWLLSRLPFDDFLLTETAGAGHPEHCWASQQ